MASLPIPKGGVAAPVGPQGGERAARIEQLLESQAHRLKFPTTLEAAFRTHFLQEGIARLRFGMLTGLLLFVAFGTWDVSSFPPEVLVPSLALRFGLACPLMAIVLFATYQMWSPRTFDLLRLGMALGVGLAVVAIVAIANASGLHANPLALFLVTVAAYTVTGMRTPHAAITGCGLLLMQVTADLLTEQNAAQISEAVVFILSANSLGYVSAVSHEREARTSFLRMKLLECRAHLDGLTGIANRRAFDRAVEQAFESAAREKTGVVIAIFDVDRFKEYNDRLGHMAGDACLQRIARAIEQLARRPLDMAARVGGEEFAVLWYDSSPHGADKLAAAICEAVAGLTIERPDEGPRHRVTVSVGAVHLDPSEATPLGAMTEADEALYEAKRAGRDRVVVRKLECGYAVDFQPSAASGASRTTGPL